MFAEECDTNTTYRAGKQLLNNHFSAAWPVLSLRSSNPHLIDYLFFTHIRLNPATMDVQKMIDDAAANKLTKLNLRGMELTSLPNISHLNSLQTLDADHNKLQTLPAVLPGLQALSVSCNNLQTLPSLPPALRELYVPNNVLRTLPTFPSGMRVLSVSDNRLQTLPTLPSILQWLDISNNNLQALPPLPSILQVLFVSGNNLQSLPTLPPTLQALYVPNNKLQTLPFLPSALQQIDIANNNVRVLPDLSHLTKLQFLDISNNPIAYSHINNADHPLLKNKIIFNQHDIVAFNIAVSLFTNKNTYFRLLPRDIINIIKEYIGYVIVTLQIR